MHTREPKTCVTRLKTKLFPSLCCIHVDFNIGAVISTVPIVCNFSLASEWIYIEKAKN